MLLMMCCSLHWLPAVTGRSSIGICNCTAQLMAAGGEILATTSVQAAYHEGRGSITVRGKVAVETDSGAGRRGSKGRRKGGDLIVITELPYQTNKVPLGCHICSQIRVSPEVGQYGRQSVHRRCSGGHLG